MKIGKGKKKVIIISAIVVVVVLILGIWVWQSPPLQEKLGVKPIDKLNDVRNQTLLTPTKKIESTTPQLGDTDVRFRIFDVSMDKNGITPPEIVVNQGDTVQFNFTAVDGKYDLIVKQFAIYIYPVSQGAAPATSFIAKDAGNFPIACYSFCPPGGGKSANLEVLQ